MAKKLSEKDPSGEREREGSAESGGPTGTSPEGNKENLGAEQSKAAAEIAAKETAGQTPPAASSTVPTMTRDGGPAVAVSAPQNTILRDAIPSQKPRDSDLRTDGGRTFQRVAPAASERDDGKAVLTGELAEAVAKSQEESGAVARSKKASKENPVQDADRTVLDRQTPALAMKVLQRSLDEAMGMARADSYEATEPWVEADLAEDVGLNGRTFLRGRQWVPQAVLETFPHVAKAVAKDKE